MHLNFNFTYVKKFFDGLTSMIAPHKKIFITQAKLAFQTPCTVLNPFNNQRQFKLSFNHSNMSNIQSQINSKRHSSKKQTFASSSFLHPLHHHPFSILLLCSQSRPSCATLQPTDNSTTKIVDQCDCSL